MASSSAILFGWATLIYSGGASFQIDDPQNVVTFLLRTRWALAVGFAHGALLYLVFPPDRVLNAVLIVFLSYFSAFFVPWARGRARQQTKE